MRTVAGDREGRQAVQGVGIGTALREARVLRGKSLEEASRETRIRLDYLQALERERFGDLLGDVYVRGFLRSYSSYLGLDADKVLAAYSRRFGGLAPALPDPLPVPVRARRSFHPHLPELVRNHPSWAVLVMAALTLMVGFGASGILSRSEVPGLADAASPSGAVQVLPTPVTVGIKARQDVQVSVRLDGGGPIRFLLHAREVRSFEASDRIDLELGRGGVAEITVNGFPLGRPGEKGERYTESFRPHDFRGSTSDLER